MNAYASTIPLPLLALVMNEANPPHIAMRLFLNVSTLGSFAPVPRSDIMPITL